MPAAPILVINAGSSSLKFGLYDLQDGDERLQADGLADGIGRPKSTLTLTGPAGETLRSEQVEMPSSKEALSKAAQWIADLGGSAPVAIGHRVVHGGPKLVEHQRITPQVLKELRACVHFAPLHVPVAIDLMEEAQAAWPGVPEFACFDTAFHRTLPETASRFALPQALFEKGIRRYGFHGLSYESIVRQLGASIPQRTVVAHLGSGASLAALRQGVSVDTSMGLTPTGGIPMATRSGDLDPGVLLYLLRNEGATADSLEDLLNHHAGLLALSGGTSDMRDLESAADQNNRAATLAIEIFSMSIRKTIAAYAAVLGGIDLLVFTGGIGQHSAHLRSSVAEGLGFLGLRLDEAANQKHAPSIAAADSASAIRVLPSQEDLEIALHCRALLARA